MKLLHVLSLKTRAHWNKTVHNGLNCRLVHVIIGEPFLSKQFTVARSQNQYKTSGDIVILEEFLWKMLFLASHLWPSVCIFHRAELKANIVNMFTTVTWWAFFAGKPSKHIICCASLANLTTYDQNANYGDYEVIPSCHGWTNRSRGTLKTQAWEIMHEMKIRFALLHERYRGRFK